MIKYAYLLTDFTRWLNQFSRQLQIPLKNGILSLPRELGEGTLETLRLPDGVSCLVLNFSLSDDLQLLSEGSPSSPAGLTLFFNQVKTSELYVVRDNGSPVSEKSSQRGTILLSSTGHQQETIFPRNSRIKAVGLHFPPSFLRYHVRKDILADLFQYAEQQTGYSEPIPFECRQFLEDIFNADPTSPLHHLLLQNRALQLTEKFLSSFLSRSTVIMSEGKTWAKGREKDLEALKSIVRILSDNQLSKFPSIEALSKTAMMSSTKLKSRFKQIYGMKLYEFYNRHRLEQAKEMLKTGNYSVKQVGVNIGFSNLSNFAKAFKKEFGVLPKEVLKNK
ncbi:MAG: helix-turn-helix transcriptional regulator [Bacteroidetes bacterium]|nr:helix-turn-helix transcriptional regulator [Bacteroidota bacterium]